MLFVDSQEERGEGMGAAKDHPARSRAGIGVEAAPRAPSLQAPAAPGLPNFGQKRSTPWTQRQDFSCARDAFRKVSSEK